MFKKSLILLIIFYNNLFAFGMINEDYLKDSAKLCQIKYSIEKNNLIYQYYDIYAESGFCGTGFTHCKKENKGKIIYNNKNFIITTKGFYDIKYILFNEYLIKNKMIEFNFYYFTLFIVFIFFYKRKKFKK